MLERESWKRSASTKNWPTYGVFRTLGAQQACKANKCLGKSSEVHIGYACLMICSDLSFCRWQPEWLPEKEIRLQGISLNKYNMARLLTSAATIHIHSRLECRFRTPRSCQSHLSDQILRKADRISGRHPISTRTTRVITPGCQQHKKGSP
jgi:hypothetical protein